MVSVIIVAYNEEKSIHSIISSVLGHPSISEIIVVDDGSTDATSVIAKGFDVNLIRLDKNQGKASAMSTGVNASKSKTILFLDADVYGYNYEKISKIIDPVIQGKYEMFVGIRERNMFFFNKYAHFFPIISGERAMTRSLWEKIPKKYKKGFEIEIASNYIAKLMPKSMSFTLISGITHVTKEKKFGLIDGFWRRLIMIYQVVLVSIELYIFGYFKKII